MIPAVIIPWLTGYYGRAKTRREAYIGP
jgi:hypothetical protein